HLRAAYQHRSQPARSHALLQTIVDCGANLPNRQASALDPTDLPQARRDHPRPRVLQLPRAGAEEGAGRPHRGARSLRFLAADHLRPLGSAPDAGTARGREPFAVPPAAAPRRPPPPGGGGRRAPPPGAGARGPLIPPIARLCSATPPSRCGLLLQINYLVNRT